MKLNTSKCKKKLQWENEVTADPIDLCGATTKIWVVVMCNNPDLGINFPPFPLANDVHSEED